jgi:hypothetical protein
LIRDCGANLYVSAGVASRAIDVTREGALNHALWERVSDRD